MFLSCFQWGLLPESPEEEKNTPFHQKQQSQLITLETSNNGFIKETSNNGFTKTQTF